MTEQLTKYVIRVPKTITELEAEVTDLQELLSCIRSGLCGAGGYPHDSSVETVMGIIDNMGDCRLDLARLREAVREFLCVPDMTTLGMCGELSKLGGGTYDVGKAQAVGEQLAESLSHSEAEVARLRMQLDHALGAIYRMATLACAISGAETKAAAKTSD